MREVARAEQHLLVYNYVSFSIATISSSNICSISSVIHISNNSSNICSIISSSNM